LANQYIVCKLVLNHAASEHTLSGAHNRLGPLQSNGNFTHYYTVTLFICGSTSFSGCCPLPRSGILYRSTSSRQQHSSPSRNTWKRSYCNDRTH